MKVENYLKNYQPVIYQTFVNSLTLSHLNHAYLIVGHIWRTTFRSGQVFWKINSL